MCRAVDLTRVVVQPHFDAVNWNVSPAATLFGEADDLAIRVLAECCGVAVSTIASWQARGARSSTMPARRPMNEGLRGERSPQMHVIYVVRPERAGGLWPKINLRAEWARIRLYPKPPRRHLTDFVLTATAL